MSQIPEVLTKSEWESLLWQVPSQVRGLVMRLGIHHRAFEKPTPDNCPVCGAGEQIGISPNLLEAAR